MASILRARSKKIAICMGSQSDWHTMQNAANTLDDLEAAYEVKIISAHRTPARITTKITIRIKILPSFISWKVNIVTSTMSLNALVKTSPLTN